MPKIVLGINTSDLGIRTHSMTIGATWTGSHMAAPLSGGVWLKIVCVYPLSDYRTIPNETYS